MMHKETNKAFWAEGAGAMCWLFDEGGRYLYILVPSKRFPRGFDTVRAYCNHAPNNWNAPGDVPGWDGNEEAPSLHPSIDCGQGEFHGFVKRGRLTQDAKGLKPYPLD